MPDPNFIPPGGTPPAVPPETPPAGDPPAGDPQPPKDVFEVFERESKAVNPDFSLPEKFGELSPEEKFSFLKENLSSPDPYSDDTFIQSYLKAKESGVPANEFLSMQNTTEMIKNTPPKEFLINYYKQVNGKSEDNPDGYSDEDVENYVGGLNRIELEQRANALKQDAISANDVTSEAYQAKLSEQTKIEAEAFNKEAVPAAVTKIFTEMAEFKDLGGIPHTPEEQAAFKEVFTDLVSINPETGYSRARELFADDKTLYKALYILNKLDSKGENSLKAYLSGFKEKYKKEILDKTRFNPREESGAYSNVSVPDKDTFV